MKPHIRLHGAVLLGIALAAMPTVGIAQSPPGYPSATAPAAPVFTAAELQDLVGRFALYPDDLVALILPASTTPLEVVKAQRFLTKYAADKTLKPDASLPQPVLTLMAYPDVINLMGDDLEWTESLGDAFTSQQQDVLDAIQIFRRKAQSAGNLKSDDKQTIVVKEETVEIVPAKPEVIYVPQYQPATVIVTQPAPVVTYAPTAYPVYYHPGAAVAVAATVGYIAGANSAYGMNWYGGSIYRAPYAAHYDHIQDERMDYANNAREDWQDYGKSSREDWQKHANDAQDQRQKNTSNNQSQRQDAIAGGQEQRSANQGQRQDSVAKGQEQRTANQGQRQDAAGNAQASSRESQAQRQNSAQQRQSSTVPKDAQGWKTPTQTPKASGGNAGAATRPSAASSSRPSAASSQQFGRQPERSSSGAFGGASSGARAQNYSARGEQSRAGASRGGGGGGASRGGGGGGGGGGGRERARGR